MNKNSFKIKRSNLGLTFERMGTKPQLSFNSLKSTPRQSRQGITSFRNGKIEKKMGSVQNS